jgi:hypothetical protein
MVHFDPETHTYTLNGERLPSITQILKGEGFIDTAFFTEYGRDRGSIVHRITHWHDTGELDPESVDPALEGYLSAWRKFRAESGFKPYIIEQPMASEVYRFAGTPDRIGVMDGDDAIPEIKTGEVQPWTGLQTAAQEILYGKRAKRYAVRLTEDGKYKLIPFTDRNDRGVFLAAVSCFWWKRANMKGERT